LYIDKDEKHQQAFASAFGDEYHIYLAGSGQAGLDIMEQRTIQLVICDEKLPDISGIHLLEKIMSFHPNCTRMIQADPHHMDIIMQAVERGIAFQYMSFPWKHEELKVTLDSAMEVYFLKSENRSLERYLEDIRQTLERKVMERTRKIEQQRVNMTDSIRYASRIMESLMLTPGELSALLPPHFVLNKPKDIVSGDFYWVSEKNGQLILAVVDCTGHGVPGAFMSILGINLLNDIVGKMAHPVAGEILDALRIRVIRTLGQRGRKDEAKEGMEMALVIVDPENNVMQFAGAFSPLYLLSEGEFKEYRGDRMPIGIYHDEEVPFTTKEVPFRENDVIYMFSDGYVDQIGGLNRKTFRSVRFKKLIREIWNRPMKEQRAILREEHEIWRAGQEQIDDILVMGVKLTF
jgi:serine phosphatase RsbU (regulator of sigma subunit)